MPTYDYKCPKCDEIMEVNFNYKELFDWEPRCHKCNEHMVRIISKPSVHFKGTGFYETDYKGKT